MGKIIAVILVSVLILGVFGALGFSIKRIYDELPKDPVELVSNIEIPNSGEMIDYGAVPVFGENMRFNHNNISFNIEDACSDKRATSMREAFQMFEDEMGIISFYEVGVNDADISIGCSDDFIGLGENLFAGGEGGPVNFTDTPHFKTIHKGKIFLYMDQQCEQPLVELHELLHVFGFDHSPDPANIMYNISRCDQKVTPDIVDLINELYSIKALPDARISELVAVKKGKYLDFNITVLNEGLNGIANLSLTLLSNEKVIDTISLGELGIGFGRTLQATNLKLPSLNIGTIDFVLDYESIVEELDEDNNVVQMTVSTS